MKKITIFVFLSIISLFNCIGQISPSIDAQLQFKLDSVCAQYNIKGASAAVLVPNIGIWKGVFGISTNTQPITTNMLFGIGSNTKTYISTILLKMKEDNLLDLDDTIGTWISHPNISGQITIRQLLNHTSGLYNFTSNSALWSAVFSNLSAIWLPEQILNYVNAPNFSPGTSWGYSNTNYLVAGLIIKQMFNQNLSITLADLLQQHNLTNTILYPETSLTGPLANIWTINYYQPYLEDIITLYNFNHNSGFSVAWAAGGILSTAEENVLFMNKLLSGQIISNASLQEMKQWITLSSIKAYGLGLFRTKNFNGRTVYGHGGTNLGFINENIVDSINGVTISVLTNQDSISNGIILNQVVSALHKVTLNLPVSANEINSNNLISVFPNPAIDKINVENNSGKNLRAQLLDLAGRIIYNEEINRYGSQISLNNFTSGLYIMRVIDIDSHKIYFNEKFNIVK